ncbi:MAG: DUF1990 domain-containing protein [Deltaproteobacteria bacterium]|jgi:uncharacterized protein (UPF0548 family)|nr:DUF1990 domain-containing protein [Deltaproteobacteria bacterium]
MWSITRPSAARIAAAIRDQSPRPVSYAEVGRSDGGDAPPGFDLDHNRLLLGHGEPAFRAACDALRAWRMFPAPWTAIEPPGAPIATGTVVAMLAHSLGLWWLNTCRIVYVVDEESPIRRFGFAYGTLPRHVEKGEERFTVEWLADDSVWYDIRAFSRPRYWMVRLGYPIARALQRRFVRDSKAAMQATVAAAVADRT